MEATPNTFNHNFTRMQHEYQIASTCSTLCLIEASRSFGQIRAKTDERLHRRGAHHILDCLLMGSCTGRPDACDSSAKNAVPCATTPVACRQKSVPWSDLFVSNQSTRPYHVLTCCSLFARFLPVGSDCCGRIPVNVLS